ncbi:hypothetical protein [Brucella melitensis]|uniref:hypothetical protein n=1 Tax=Brucella melitensis TaxID=29459 RepID=UPI0002CE4678|nr:hypothetical protein [Brucella melitensis]ENS55924.1 hypothetical protein C036_02372 [Brucella melitensis F1/06 B10]
MQFSMWTYPWDIQDLGLDMVCSDLREKVGGNTISLATSYHAGRFFQPRSPQQKAYFPEDGTIYYTPDEALWEGKEIRPLVAKNCIERGDMLQRLIERRREGGGLRVSCWTVGLHNSRLGELHPGHVTRNAFGNANYYNLCPSSPAARDYVVTLVADITSRYQPDMVELESVNFMGFAHEHHHEKDGVGLTDEDDFFMSLCFCDHCKARAKAAGVDIDNAQAVVKGFIAEACEREVPQKQFADFPQAGISAFAKWPSLYAFLQWRTEPVTSLIGEIRAVADPASRIVLIDLKDGWLGGVDLEEAVRACDGIILCCYDMGAEQIEKTIRDARSRLPADKYVGLGLSLFYSLVKSKEEFAARVDAGKRAGVDGINFYNYGLIPQKRLEWIGAALAR